MKNKISLLIITIFSFALYVGRVEADDSGCYTCLSLGEVSWGEKPSRQCPNGEWELNSDIKNYIHNKVFNRFKEEEESK